MEESSLYYFIVIPFLSSVRLMFCCFPVMFEEIVQHLIAISTSAIAAGRPCFFSVSTWSWLVADGETPQPSCC
jgi:hypothetical protein